MENNYKGFWQVFFFLLSYFRKLKNRELIFRTVVSVSFVLLTIIINSLTPILFKMLIRLMESSKDQYGQKVIVFLLFGYGFSWTLGQVVSPFRELIVVRVFCRLLRLLSLDIVEHLLSLPMRYHTFKQTGSIVAALKQAQDAMPDILVGSLFCVFPVFAEIIIAATIITYCYGMLYGFIILGLFLLYFLFTMYASKKILGVQLKFNEARQQEFGKGTDTLINIETVKYFGKVSLEVKRYDELLRLREFHEVRFFETLELVHLLQGVIIGLGFSITVILSGLGVLSGKLLVSDFAMINAFVLQFVGPFMSLGKHIRIIRRGVANIQNALQILDTKPEVEDQSATLEIQGKSVEIEFVNVEFGYFSDVKILRGLSFKIPEKKMTAIVGSTGSGKSTITKLLFRFYSVSGGSILLNGENLSRYSTHCLTESFGIVPQSVAMFNDTLHYNLTYAKPDATDDEVWEALKIAQLQYFVKTLPHGFETMVGEHGVRLSGGEKQRLAIARAVLKKPKFFIFDEATSALDTNTERTIQQSLMHISKDITTLVIAHRLSTIINADQIVVLEYGAVVEIGTHQELLSKNGVYCKLWNEQFS